MGYSEPLKATVRRQASRQHRENPQQQMIPELQGILPSGWSTGDSFCDDHFLYVDIAGSFTLDEDDLWEEDFERQMEDLNDVLRYEHEEEPADYTPPMKYKEDYDLQYTAEVRAKELLDAFLDPTDWRLTISPHSNEY